MSTNRGYNPARQPDDTFMKVLESVARFLLFVGGLATLATIGFLVYYFILFSTGGMSGSEAQARSNIEIFYKVLIPAVFAVGVATTFLYWGEEVLSALQLIGAALLYFSPLYLPSLVGGSPNATAGLAAQALQTAGMVLGALAIVVAMVDVIGRVRVRAREGSKADQLKYGKGIKEEKDIQNVFLGKCWQLPFCRKFVRERCPIYHSQRTCWKERVGCMCEEKVIQNAMAGKTIPKDAVAAAAFIPRNAKLSPEAKAERCRQCIIYNEHQRQKYKAALPLVLLVFGLAYGFGRGVLLDTVDGAIKQADKVIGVATFRGDDSSLSTTNPIMLAGFKELLLICGTLILLAYVMKLVEYLFFKLKV